MTPWAALGGRARACVISVLRIAVGAAYFADRPTVVVHKQKCATRDCTPCPAFLATLKCAPSPPHEANKNRTRIGQAVVLCGFGHKMVVARKSPSLQTRPQAGHGHNCDKAPFKPCDGHLWIVGIWVGRRAKGLPKAALCTP